MGRSALPAGILLLGLLASSAHARLGDPPPRALASKAGPRADLVVTVAGRAPAALRPSQELTATVAVRNRGRRRAGRSVVRFFLSANGRRDARDVRLDGLLAVKRLKPRGTARGSARLRAPGSLHGGAFRMLACADDLARVREGNERNNCRVAPGSVRVAGAAAPPGPPAPPQSPAPDGGPGAPDPGSPPAELPAPGDGPPAHPQPPTPLERGAATPLADAVAFLYQGRDAIQQGVAPGTISDKRIAVLRGRVLDADGKPLEGVRVTVLDHGEYGRTWTRADGHFDMAVNGARLDLVYAKDGYLPMQREVDAPWQDYLAVEDAIMVRPDAQVTRIDPDSTEPFQVARGSSGDGTAPATLLFARGTKATMEMPDGSTRPAPGMSVRATEFPAGSQRSLPGTMPGNVGPTYAVEFTLDEAISAGAESVSFDRPVINYTGNFIDAPVGGAVPTAYYDRGRGEWIPQPNGRVIAIAGESDGRALVDADETPGPDSAESLAALGITDAERAQLAELYAPGQELWRVPIEHFTPWDHNNPYGPPRGAKPPKLKEFEWKDPNDPCNRRGSIIACESQTLGEEIPLTGTGLRLRYDSSRQAGTVATRALEIPITDGTVPPRLQGIELTIDVAGRHIVKRWCDPSFPATGASTCQGMDPIAPDLHHRFEWDGRDAYGRPVTGRPYATITVTYVYELTLYESNDEMDASFGAFPPEDFTLLDGAAYCGNQNPAADPEANRLQHFYCGVLVKQTAQRALGRWDAGEVDGLGGLTISAHHGYDPNEKVVYRGDGGVIRSDPLGAVTRTLVNSGDYLTEIATGPDGSVYWHTSQGENRIWRLTPGGERQLVGGRERGTTNADRGEPTGDGGPAVDAVLGNTSVDGMDVGPDGSVYFTVEGANGTAGYVRRIRPDGIIETLAGVPWDSTLPTGSNGDGGPALAAKLGPLQGLDVAPDGSIYFGERDARPNGFKNLLRRITADGAITTVAGGGADLAADDEDLGAGEPALDQQLRRVYGVAAAEDGSVYLSDPVSKVVQRVGTDGRITRVAGTHGIGIGYGANGADAAIGEPTDLALARDGELYVRTNDFASGGSEVKIVRVDTGNGLVTPIAGRTNAYPGCVYCLSPEGEAAGATMIESNTVGLVALPDGRLVYGDGRDQVRTIEPALQGFDTDAIAVPSPEGAEVYVFNGRGRHLRTLDAVTGVRLWSFAYDDAKRLVAVTDRDGRSIRIERAADGRPTAVVAPGGARTAIGLDAAGRAERVVNPAQEVTTLGYGADGLLASFALPGRPPARFDYDDEGRLVRDESPTGAVQTLARTETGLSTTVKITSGEGRVTKYVAEALPNGDRRRAIVRPSGATVELLVKPDGTRVRTAPDGTRTTTTVDRDPRWGMRVPVPVSEVTETPGGRRATTEVNRAVSLATPTDPLSLQSLTTTVTRRAAGRTPRVARSTYTASTRTVEHTSATGKRTTATLDEAGRVVEVDPDGPSQGALAPVRTTFDAAGHVTRIAQGAQHWSFAYDGRDRVVSRTDAKGRVVSFGYDDADRIVRKTFPGDRVYGYAWRGDGALKSLTMPSGAVYAYAADDAQRPVSMALPGAGSYARTLDGDGALELLRLPSGATRDPSLDAAGRETATDYGPERDALAFPADDERPERLERIPDTGAAQSLTLAHDGFLPKLAELGGPAAGRYAYAFDDFLELTGTTLESGGDTVATAMAYDADGHATKQGPFTLTRNGPGGRLSALADGTLAGTFAYDALGRLKQRQLSAGGAVRYANEVAYGAAGQVESRTERVGETTRTFAYDYDANGRLREVRRGGELVESYDYDANGNRIARTLGGGPLETSAYDGQDRITRRGQTAHVVDADGFLRERGADRLEYSPSGALLSVRVDGDTVRYGYDALGRRVSRVDGAGTAQYLYGNPGNAFLLTATRDAGGRLTTYLYDEEDALYALERGGVRYYVGADQVGSPRVVFKGDGTIVKEVAYDAFGGVVADSDPAFELAIGFAGGLADGATGLVRFGLRDYDPASGRFTARDPIFFSGSPTNLYAYANSDPVSLRDPTGLWCVGGGGFVGVGGGMQYCRDEGKNSICVEGGVGAGGGFEVDPFGEVAKTGSSLQGELTGKYGPVNGTLGFELDLDCFNLKGSAKLGTAIGTAVSVDTDGGMSSTWGGSGEEDFNGRGVRKRDGSWGGKTEGKLVVKGCAQF